MSLNKADRLKRKREANAKEVEEAKSNYEEPSEIEYSF